MAAAIKDLGVSTQLKQRLQAEFGDLHTLYEKVNEDPTCLLKIKYIGEKQASKILDALLNIDIEEHSSSKLVQDPENRYNICFQEPKVIKTAGESFVEDLLTILDDPGIDKIFVDETEDEYKHGDIMVSSNKIFLSKSYFYNMCGKDKVKVMDWLFDHNLIYYRTGIDRKDGRMKVFKIHKVPQFVASEEPYLIIFIDSLEDYLNMKIEINGVEEKQQDIIEIPNSNGTIYIVSECKPIGNGEYIAYVCRQDKEGYNIWSEEIGVYLFSDDNPSAGRLALYDDNANIKVDVLNQIIY